jgi:hypothetical protein
MPLRRSAWWQIGVVQHESRIAADRRWEVPPTVCLAPKTVKLIANMGAERGAWFKYSEGNMLSLGQSG